MTVTETILFLTKRLFPTGRAFRIPHSSWSEKMHKGLIESEARAYNDAISTLDSAIPDNGNFTEEDATDWERRLGLITNTMVPLEDRKLAILRKINHPGTIKARQHYLYLQGQLRAAGFDVYVYENRFPDGSGGYITKTPIQVYVDLAGEHGQLGANQLGDFQLGTSADVAEDVLLELITDPNTQLNRFQLGDQQLSSGVTLEYKFKVANHIDEAQDLLFKTYGTHLKHTFFISGNPLGSFANVDINRKNEFRQLILKTKPTHSVAFLFINFV